MTTGEYTMWQSTGGGRGNINVCAKSGGIELRQRGRILLTLNTDASNKSLPEVKASLGLSRFNV